MRIKDIIKELQGRVDQEEEVCFTIWCAEDVRQEQDPDNPLTDDEVSDILDMMKHCHDATLGINWDVIQNYIWQVIQDREKP